MNRESLFLFAAAVGLIPIALGYGLFPADSMAILFDIDASSVNASHIYRAVMGLYLALVIFWVSGALRAPLRLPALWSLTVFMFGLAAGRSLSLLVDGLQARTLARRGVEFLERLLRLLDRLVLALVGVAIDGGDDVDVQRIQAVEHDDFLLRLLQLRVLRDGQAKQLVFVLLQFWR